MHSLFAEIQPLTPRSSSLLPDSQDFPPTAAFDLLSARISDLCHRRPGGTLALVSSAPQITISDTEVSHSHLPPASPSDVFGPFDISASLIRILSIHAFLHPDHIYDQTWSFLLSPIYYVVAAAGAESVDPYQAEADAFWTFAELMGDVWLALGSRWENPTDVDINSILRSFSNRVKWADEELWNALVSIANFVCH
jgi:hypothetical protein